MLTNNYMLDVLSHLSMNIKDSVYVTNLDGEIFYTNKTFCDSYGYEVEEIMGKSSHVLCGECDYLKSKGEEICLEELNKECNHLHKSGISFSVAHLRTYVKNNEGENIAILGITTDLIEKKISDMQYKRGQYEEQKAIKIKENFIRNIGHEIRTPLNGIFGMLQLLETTDLTYEQRDYLEIAKLSTEILIKMTDSILDFSEVKNDFNYNLSEPINLLELVDNLVKKHRISATKRGIELNYLIDEDIPKIITGQKPYIYKVLDILIDNAINFTESGSVKVSITKEEDYLYRLKNKVDIELREQPLKLVFSVSDTGKGIGEDEFYNIFDTFNSINYVGAKKYSGIGLGLCVAKRIIDFLGGAITAKRLEEGGSEFTFTISFNDY